MSLTSLSLALTLADMSTPLRAIPTPLDSRNDVIRRVVKAWIGAYDMTHDELAGEIGMIPRLSLIHI